MVQLLKHLNIEQELTLEKMIIQKLKAIILLIKSNFKLE